MSVSAKGMTNVPDTIRIKKLLSLVANKKDRDIQSCIPYGKEAVRLSDSLNIPVWKARSYNALGAVYLYSAQYQEALFYLLQALRICETMNYKNLELNVLNNLGSVYHSLKRDDIAENYLKRVLEKKKLLNKDIDAVDYINLGAVFIDKKDYQQGVDYSKKALYLLKQDDNVVIIIYALGNIGEGYLKLNQNDSAEKYIMQALQLSLKNKIEHNIGRSYIQLGQIYQRQNKLKQAEQMFKQGKQSAERAGGNMTRAEAYLLLSHLYDLMHKPADALVWYKKYNVLHDSILNEQTLNKLSEVQSGYEIEKRDKEIELLNKDKQIAESNVREQKLSRNLFIAAFAFILLISFVLVRNILLKQKINKVLNEKNNLLNKKNEQVNRKNRELNQKNDLIETQKQQIENINKSLSRFNDQLINENVTAKYEVLKAKTNPHFLFNSLTTLSSIVVKDQQMAIEYIERFSELFRLILTTGEQKVVTLEQEMKIVEHYLYLQKIRFKDDLVVDIQIDARKYQYTLPPFSIQMVIENAIKHNIIEEDEKLFISIQDVQEIIEVRNNLQKKHMDIVSTSTGQKNIRERYKMIADAEPLFIETETAYIVKLPLLESEEILA